MALLSGRYQILGKIGEGAGADVFKAHDPRMKRYLAVKLLKEQHDAHSELFVRFLREAKAAGGLTHPNIVTIYDVGEHENKPFIAMELLNGQFLDHYINTRTKFSWEDILSIGIQLASGLQCAHTNGVIHRDLKPANIAWSPYDKIAKITDFGIARLVNSLEATQTETTRVGQVLGTPKYMSPEQISGQSVDTRSDLFSLGVVLYQLATGKKPFMGDTLAALTYQIAHQQPPAIQSLVADKNTAIIQIIEKLIEKNPNDRYQNCEQLLAAFKLAKHSNANISRPSKKPVLLMTSLATLLGIGAVITYFLIPPTIDNSALNVDDTLQSINEQNSTIIDPLEQQASLKIVIDQQISDFECASLNVQVNAASQVTISGHLSSEDDMLSLMDIMDSMPNITNVSYEIDNFAWPYCEVASIISPENNGNIELNSGLSIETMSNPNLSSSNEDLSVELSSPNYDAYVYIDFVRADGQVFHLFPDRRSRIKQTMANTSLSFDGLQKRWDLENIDSENMIIAIASVEPLENNYQPTQETAEQYLTRLHRQIVVNQTKLSASYIMIPNE